MPQSVGPSLIFTELKAEQLLLLSVKSCSGTRAKTEAGDWGLAAVLQPWFAKTSFHSVANGCSHSQGTETGQSRAALSAQDSLKHIGIL